MYFFFELVCILECRLVTETGRTTVIDGYGPEVQATSKATWSAHFTWQLTVGGPK